MIFFFKWYLICLQRMNFFFEIGRFRTENIQFILLQFLGMRFCAFFFKMFRNFDINGYLHAVYRIVLLHVVHYHSSVTFNEPKSSNIFRVLIAITIDQIFIFDQIEIHFITLNVCCFIY